MPADIPIGPTEKVYSAVRWRKERLVKFQLRIELVQEFFGPIINRTETHNQSWIVTWTILPFRGMFSVIHSVVGVRLIMSPRNSDPAKRVLHRNLNRRYFRQASICASYNSVCNAQKMIHDPHYCRTTANRHKLVQSRYRVERFWELGNFCNAELLNHCKVLNQQWAPPCY